MIPISVQKTALCEEMNDIHEKKGHVNVLQFSSHARFSNQLMDNRSTFGCMDVNSRLYNCLTGNHATASLPVSCNGGEQSTMNVIGTDSATQIGHSVNVQRTSQVQNNYMHPKHSSINVHNIPSSSGRHFITVQEGSLGSRPEAFNQMNQAPSMHVQECRRDSSKPANLQKSVNLLQPKAVAVVMPLTQSMARIDQQTALNKAASFIHAPSGVTPPSAESSVAHAKTSFFATRATPCSSVELPDRSPTACELQKSTSAPSILEGRSRESLFLVPPGPGMKDGQLRASQPKDTFDTFGQEADKWCGQRTTTWTLQSLRQLIDSYKNTESNINGAAKVIHLYWDGSSQNMANAIKSDYMKIMKETFEVLLSHKSSVILTQLHYESQSETDKRFLILEPDSLVPLSEYTSSWLNLNDQLDDIDKDQGHSWSLRVSNKQVTEQMTLYGGGGGGETQTSAAGMQSRAPPVSPDGETAARAPDTPEKSPRQTTSTDPDSHESDGGEQSIKIQVLSPDTAKRFFYSDFSGSVGLEKGMKNGPVEISTGETVGGLKQSKPMKREPHMADGRGHAESYRQLERYCCLAKFVTEVARRDTRFSFCRCREEKFSINMNVTTEDARTITPGESRPSSTPHAASGDSKRRSARIKKDKCGTPALPKPRQIRIPDAPTSATQACSYSRKPPAQLRKTRKGRWNKGPIPVRTKGSEAESIVCGTEADRKDSANGDPLRLALYGSQSEKMRSKDESYNLRKITWSPPLTVHVCSRPERDANKYVLRRLKSSSVPSNTKVRKVTLKSEHKKVKGPATPPPRHEDAGKLRNTRAMKRKRDSSTSSRRIGLRKRRSPWNPGDATTKSKYELGNPAVTPVPSDLVLKFKVLPETFHFADPDEHHPEAEKPSSVKECPKPITSMDTGNLMTWKNRA
ncbi:uncharacterized protein LOC114767194 [Denticeps clupeoides]|uniref:uncharacterized protein LOC114767194 n=1 Tax=Denticeps clupeoides TaxID=299321 RepID=UPI0010A3AF21|nr:uncharacterized protein LOC114767194 [Denticeps clupeoides]